MRRPLCLSKASASYRDLSAGTAASAFMIRVPAKVDSGGVRCPACSPHWKSRPASPSRSRCCAAGLPGARWIEPENYHITLRFIGDIDEPTADEVADALMRVDRPRFELALHGLAAFGSRKPHSLFAGVKMSPALKELQGEHERIMQRIGLEPERRKFTPHVTLARLRGASRSRHGGLPGAPRRFQHAALSGRPLRPACPRRPRPAAGPTSWRRPIRWRLEALARAVVTQPNSPCTYQTGLAVSRP